MSMQRKIWRGAIVVGCAVLVGLLAAMIQSNEPGHAGDIVKDATPVHADVIEGSGGTLLAVKQWTPSADIVLMCENYAGFLPMRPADLWVSVDVPDSGRVIVEVSALTANEKPDLHDYWGLMVEEDVVASGIVGRGDVMHRAAARFVVDGLAPGPTRIDVAHRSDEGGAANIFVGPTYGPAVIEVWSA